MEKITDTTVRQSGTQFFVGKKKFSSKRVEHDSFTTALLVAEVPVGTTFYILIVISPFLELCLF